MMSEAHLEDLWRDIGTRISVFTASTAADIPSSPGVYGWFVPLWKFSNDLEELLQTIGRIQSFDWASRGPPVRESKVKLPWSEVELELRSQPRFRLTGPMRTAWRDLHTDAEAERLFRVPLMLGSLLLPPLYVGKTKDLAQRYAQHTQGVGGSSISGFAQRFQCCVSQYAIPLDISDLLFVSISTQGLVRDAELNDTYTQLLESLLMRLARPPFSEQ